MRLLIIRHADPYYPTDSLTETGRNEARLLAERLANTDIDSVYVSPLGRAQATASYTLEKKNMTAVTCDWLREFKPNIYRPDSPDELACAWDWLPTDLAAHPEFLDRNEWMNEDHMTAFDVGGSYNNVCTEFDNILAEHGYRRDGDFYRVTEPNRKTLAFFCHFGAGSVLISHLLNVSPMVIWHGTCLAPSSVSILHTEERREGIALFRASALGDTSHLFAAGCEPSFSARFCEIFDSGERHD